MKVVNFLEFREVWKHFDIVAGKNPQKVRIFRISRQTLGVMPLGFLAWVARGCRSFLFQIVFWLPQDALLTLVGFETLFSVFSGGLWSRLGLLTPCYDYYTGRCYE